MKRSNRRTRDERGSGGATDFRPIGLDSDGGGWISANQSDESCRGRSLRRVKEDALSFRVRSEEEARPDGRNIKTDAKQHRRDMDRKTPGKQKSLDSRTIASPVVRGNVGTPLAIPKTALYKEKLRRKPGLPASPFCGHQEARASYNAPAIVINGGIATTNRSLSPIDRGRIHETAVSTWSARFRFSG